jgi:hypothetical protein
MCEKKEKERREDDIIVPPHPFFKKNIFLMQLRSKKFVKENFISEEEE